MSSRTSVAIDVNCPNGARTPPTIINTREVPITKGAVKLVVFVSNLNAEPINREASAKIRRKATGETSWSPETVMTVSGMDSRIGVRST